MPFQKIVVPIDFEETSAYALERAIELAAKLGAAVTAVHVYSLIVYTFPDGSYLPLSELAEAVRQGAQRKLDAVLEAHRGRGVRLDGVLREGRSADEICKVAAEISADLIVMGTHGRGAIGRALLGSVATAVLRRAKIPVMTLRKPAA
ncbi:universal stress protein [Polyangium jinanense]|uniref:Universal stress protein n=1 Tax=Polyangium jinanense TaxID=2829994 RepID=A0A9X3XD93_9BACT|nr:universal stress protein [Polyangium jinanense]MDC3956824.1 universal stress protein [Polyangium jinanense]MDC3987180.1 universal stress protein [Polyangium jinanense]